MAKEDKTLYKARNKKVYIMISTIGTLLFEIGNYRTTGRKHSLKLKFTMFATAKITSLV